MSNILNTKELILASLKGLDNNQLNKVKQLAKLRNENPSYQTIIYLKLYDAIEQKALNTSFMNKDSVEEFYKFATDRLLSWFPHWTEGRVKQEISHIRCYSNLYFKKISWELDIIYNHYFN